MNLSSATAPAKGRFLCCTVPGRRIWLAALVMAFTLAGCVSKPAPHSGAADGTVPDTVSPAQPQTAGRKALDVARSLLGTPYRYGGTDPRGFDCSGLVRYAFGQAGIRLPRTSRDIFRQCRPIPPQAIEPGDLVFFTISSDKIAHVGIYADNQRFIHAPSSGKGVGYARLDNPYWQQRLVAVGRLIPGDSAPDDLGAR